MPVQAHEAIVRNALYWVGTVLVLVNLARSVARVIENPAAYVPGFAPTVLAVIGACTAVALGRCIGGRNAAIPLRAVVVVSCLALVAHPWTAGPQPEPYPPLLHVLGAGMVVSAFVGYRASLVIIPAFAAVVAGLRVPYLGPVAALSEAALLAVSGYVGTACVEIFQRAGRTVVRAVDATWRLREDSIRATRRAQERERWDGLVHDKVLGALRIAARAPGGTVPVAARELADEALAAFRGEGTASGEPVEQIWRRHAEHLGLVPTIDVQGEAPDDDVRDAVVGAVDEAIFNVARHSGQELVRVTGALHDDRASVTVADPGRGFAPDRTPYGSGLRTSVVGRMRAVGGDAAVESAPGRGTRVVLTWEAAPAAGEAPTEWQLRTFTPMMVLGALVLVLNVALGYPQWAAARSLAVSLVGVVAIVATTAAATLLPPTRRILVPLVAAMAVTMLALTLNIPDDAPADWRHWYLGAITAAVAAISYRFEHPAWLATAGVLVLVVVAADAACGRPAWACLVNPFPVLLATTVGALLVRRALDKAWSRVTESTRRDAELRLAIAVEEERARESGRRVSTLADSVGQALERIRSGSTVTAQESRDLELLESAARDQLAAPTLLDARLVNDLGSARARGVRVDIVSTDDPGGAPAAEPPAAGVYRDVLGEVLRGVPPRTRVRATWRSTPDASVGTISAVGEDLESVTERLRAVLGNSRSAERVAITDDDDALLLEFRA